MRYYNLSMTFATNLEGEKLEELLKKMYSGIDCFIQREYEEDGIYCAYDVSIGEIK